MSAADVTRTQVGIVGAGPAGLVLGHLLHLRGIESVILEDRDREYVEGRVRAGVLEQGTVDLLIEMGVGERLEREGLVHHGVELRFGGEGHRIPFDELTGGRGITIYGQQEVVKDLIAARLEAGAPLLFEVDDVRPVGHRLRQPGAALPARPARSGSCAATWSRAATASTASAATPCPPGALRSWEHVYPFGWLGILAEVAPSSDELIYCHHDRGFALHSMRSPELTRLYLQCDPDDDIENWPDERIWEELHTRFACEGWSLEGGADRREGHHAAAQLRDRADAARAPVPGRRRRPHRAGHRRQGAEPGRGRRARARRRAGALVLQRRRRAARGLLRGLPAAGLGARSTSPGG